MTARFFNSMLGNRYTRLPSRGENPALDGTKVHMKDRLKTQTAWFLVLVIIVIAGLGGFTLGLSFTEDRDTVPEWTYSLLRGKACPRISVYLPLLTNLCFLPTVHVDWTKQTFQYNKTFGAAPSADESTEEAWDALAPQGQGFVRYPANSSNISAVSAVHQLHCLYSIRRAYFSAANSQHKGEDHHGPSHMRHCFDYLRQSLMCAADSSLEPQHPYLPGVTGWGFPRRCQSYDELKAWAEHWRANDRYGFRDGHFPSKTQLSDGHDF